jgi:hypothetical protein
MALFVTNHSVVLNLVAIYRDLGWDAATVRDNLERRVFSANHAEAKKYRKDVVYGSGETQSDGYLLVYNFKNIDDEKKFIGSLVLEGLELSLHVAKSYCIWARQVSIVGGGDKKLYLQAVEHVDSPNFTMRVNNGDLEYFNHFKIESVQVKTCLLNEDYVEYINKSVFWAVVCSVMSLFKTKGSHINHYTPFKYIFRDSSVELVGFGSQVLPGISNVVPTFELDDAILCDSSPEYLRMFKQDLF